MPQTMTDPNMLGVRDTLNKQFGIDNSRIGYNTNNGMVQVDGQDVFKPAQNVDGTTYASQDQFNSIGGKLNSMNQQYKLMQQATNPQGLNPYQSQVGDLIGQLRGLQSQPMVSVQDVYNSPQYAAAKAQQALEAQHGISAAQEALGASGMARSSDLATAAQNVQNKANQYLETQTVPQVMSMLQNQRQQQISNTENLLNSLASLNNQANQTALGQQNAAANLLNELHQQKINEANVTGQFGGQQTLAAQKQALDQTQVMADLTGKLPDGTPTNAAQQKQLENEWHISESMGVVTPTLAQLYGIPAGTPTLAAKQLAAQIAHQNAQLGIEGMNAQTSLMNAQTNRSQANFQMDPNSPHNQYYKSLSSYKDSAGNNIVDKAYYDAIGMAQKDPMFSTLSPDQQNSVIDRYYQLIKSKQPQPSSGGGLSDQELMQQLSQYMYK